MAKRDNAPRKRGTSKTLTSNQQEWKHQISNLKRRIRDLERQGAIVDFKIPEMPKRVTEQAIKGIKNIRRRELVRGVEYKPSGEKKEIKYKPAQQINEEGKLEKWKAPERGKTKERQSEVRARKIAEDILDLAREVKAISPPKMPSEPEIPTQEPDVKETLPSYEGDSDWDEEYFDDYSWFEEQDSYFDEEAYNERKEREEFELNIADAQIDNLRGYLEGIGDEEIAAKLKTTVDNLIAVNGKVEVAKNIEANLEKIAEYAPLAVKYKDTPKGQGFVNMIAQFISGDRVLSFSELTLLEKANDYNDDFSRPV